MAIFYIKQNLVTKIVCYNMDFLLFPYYYVSYLNVWNALFSYQFLWGLEKNIALFAWPASMTDNSLPYFPKVAHY